MKKLKTLVVIVLCSGLLFSLSSCLVLVKDNPKPRGWFKNTNNPHHPKSTNPGKGNSKHKNKHK